MKPILKKIACTISIKATRPIGFTLLTSYSAEYNTFYPDSAEYNIQAITSDFALGFITKLRQKLSKDEQIRIANVRGIGYKLVVQE